MAFKDGASSGGGDASKSESKAFASVRKLIDHGIHIAIFTLNTNLQHADNIAPDNLAAATQALNDLEAEARAIYAATVVPEEKRGFNADQPRDEDGKFSGGGGSGGSDSSPKSMATKIAVAAAVAVAARLALAIAAGPEAIAVVAAAEVAREIGKHLLIGAAADIAVHALDKSSFDQGVKDAITRAVHSASDQLKALSSSKSAAARVKRNAAPSRPADQDRDRREIYRSLAYAGVTTLGQITGAPQ
jgi:hypothetical protein